MALSQALCGKHPGGLVSIRLYEATKILSAPFNHTLGGYSSLHLEEDYTPIEVAMAEGSGLWSEKEVGKDGVEHRVEFALRGCRSEALSTLHTLSQSGLVAEVVLAEGGRYLVGYSPRANADYPLRLAQGSLNTQNRPSEMPTTTLVLISTDGWFSHPLLQE